MTSPNMASAELPLGGPLAGDQLVAESQVSAALVVFQVNCAAAGVGAASATRPAARAAPIPRRTTQAARRARRYEGPWGRDRFMAIRLHPGRRTNLQGDGGHVSRAGLREGEAEREYDNRFPNVKRSVAA